MAFGLTQLFPLLSRRRNLRFGTRPSHPARQLSLPLPLDAQTCNRVPKRSAECCAPTFHHFLWVIAQMASHLVVDESFSAPRSLDRVST